MMRLEMRREPNGDWRDLHAETMPTPEFLEAVNELAGYEKVRVVEAEEGL